MYIQFYIVMPSPAHLLLLSTASHPGRDYHPGSPNIN